LATKAIWSAFPEYELCARLFFHSMHADRPIYLDAEGLAGVMGFLDHNINFSWGARYRLNRPTFKPRTC